MGIESHPFGGLTLTGEDAAKFRRQVRYGRASRAAKESAASGAERARALLKETGDA